MNNYQIRCDRCKKYIDRKDMQEHRLKNCLMTNNPLGINKSKSPAKIHPYKTMPKDDQYFELKRLYTEKRYYSAMTMKYAQKISFLMECMGLEPKKSEADKRADKDFKEKEGE